MDENENPLVQLVEDWKGGEDHGLAGACWVHQELSVDAGCEELLRNAKTSVLIRSELSNQLRKDLSGGRVNIAEW
jgi:hypothetical protein